MAEKIIKLLHLEDNDADAHLIHEAIYAEISSVNITLVDNRKDYESSLQTKDFDLIISDFALPSYDGMAALRFAREFRPDIPYIYVSGHIGEERAIEALKNGATDYVLKDKLVKLVPTIKRALNESEEKKRRKFVEKALVESEKFSRTMLNSLSAQIAVLDDSGKIVFTNKAWKDSLNEICSLPKGNSEGENYFSLCGNKNNDEAEKLSTGIKSVINNSKKNYYQEYTSGLNGRQIYYFISITTAYEDKVKKIIMSHEDISIAKEAAKKLKENEENYRSLFEHHPDAVFSLDTGGNFISLNKNVSVITQYNYGELINNPFFSLIKDNTKRVKEKFAEALDGKPRSFETKIIRKGGKDLNVSVTIIPIIVESRVVGVYGIAKDVSGRVFYEEGLKAAKEKAEEINRLKTIFLANMSHELRTPMVGILGYTDVLLDEVKDPETREMVEVIKVSSGRLLETLNLILDMSKIEAEKVDIKKENVTLLSLVKEVIKIFTPNAIKKNLYLKSNFIDAEFIIETDERLLRQIIINLVNNALKYTKEGGVEITVDSDKDYVFIKVIDTGIGISEENKKVIFEPFRQLSEGYSRSYEGTGLGLTIAKKFAKKLGGDLDLFSEEGKRSEFVLKLPNTRETGIKTVEAEIPKLPVEEAEPNIISALLVEDDKYTQEVIIKQLQKIAAVEVAGSGEEALRLIADKKFDIILMDISLTTSMSGIDVIKAIRQNSKLKNIPIIAVTAYAMLGDRKAILNSGADDYLSKPYRKEELVSKIKNLIELKNKIFPLSWK